MLHCESAFLNVVCVFISNEWLPDTWWFWHFGAKELPALPPHKLSSGPGAYTIITIEFCETDQGGRGTLSPSHLVRPCCTAPLLCCVWVLLPESCQSRSYLYSFPEPWLRGMGSGGAPPCLWWWAIDSCLPLVQKETTNIWTVISERSEPCAGGVIMA